MSYQASGYGGIKNYTTHVRLANGSWERVDEFIENCHFLSTSRIGPTLRITGKFTTLFLNSGEFLYIQISDDMGLRCDVFSDTELSDDDKKDDLKGLYMNDHSSRVPSEYRCFIFLVFQKVGRHHRRIGRAEVNWTRPGNESRPIVDDAEETIEIV